MKFSILNTVKSQAIAALAIGLLLSGCNKMLPDAIPVVIPTPTGNTIGDVLNTDTSYSIFKGAVVKAGLLAALSDRASSMYTVYAPNNTACRLSGITDAVVGVLPVASVASLVQYHIVGGQFLFSSIVPTTFPNVQEPTSLVLSAPFFRMSSFPSKRGSSFWVNTIPVISPDIMVANGVIHQMGAVLNPPSTVLAGIIYTDPNLTYFTAAIARADSGQTGLNRLDSLLRYAPLNMTVLTPTDQAFRAFLDTNLRRGFLAMNDSPAVAAGKATFLASTPGVFTNPALSAVFTPAVVKGVLAYHFLASKNTNPAAFQPDIRAFSNNFGTSPAFYTTLVNAAVAAHPGVQAQATFTGPFVSALTFRGLGTLPAGGAPFSGAAANATVRDRHAINGVTHTIDRVLIPQ